MKLKFILIGKPHSKFYEDSYSEYKFRLLKYANVEVVEMKETKLPNNPTQSQIMKGLNSEAEAVVRSLTRNDYLFVLDLHGKAQTSEKFAMDLKAITESHTSLVFVVGSSYGVSDILRKRADYLWKLSDLTFTHPLALLVTMEQVYRALKIISGETYQK